MESRFKSLSIFEFQAQFPDDASCLAHLSELKWADGFKCRYCNHGNYCAGERPYDRQCTSCNYTESPTAHTVFHKVKFPLVKAFWIVYYLSSTKKGMASTELSRKLELRQKTCWLFKRKVMQVKQRVDLLNTFGDTERMATDFFVIPYAIARGDVATYFPEANVLVPLEQKAKFSGTPASKSVVVKSRKR